MMLICKQKSYGVAIPRFLFSERATIGTMSKLLVANWKMHAPGLTEWKQFNPPKKAQTVVCPPFAYLEAVRDLKLKSALGAQDVFFENPRGGGAYTGEISLAMLKGFGAKYVIVGHSERRKWLYENDEDINKKVLAGLHAGFHVILCVGESLEVRKKGGAAAAMRFVRTQLQKDLKGIRKVPHAERLIIAYEPIWAIGTGTPAHPKDALKMALSIRRTVHSLRASIHPKILYGGSTNPENIASFVQYEEIDGALVGGASVSEKEFSKMAEIVSRI